MTEYVTNGNAHTALWKWITLMNVNFHIKHYEQQTVLSKKKKCLMRKENMFISWLPFLTCFWLHYLLLLKHFSVLLHWVLLKCSCVKIYFCLLMNCHFMYLCFYCDNWLYWSPNLRAFIIFDELIKYVGLVVAVFLDIFQCSLSCKLLCMFFFFSSCPL